MEDEKEYSYETEYLIGMCIEGESLLETVKSLWWFWLLLFIEGGVIVCLNQI